MPLRDHFRPPVSTFLPWTTLFAGWATHVADILNERSLPDGFVALESVTTAARPGIDSAAGDEPAHIPPIPRADVTILFRDRPAMDVSVRVLDGDRIPVASIEFITPSNKHRRSDRLGFAAKVAAYLQSGMSVVLIDVVTDSQWNLHSELMDLLDASSNTCPREDLATYAVAYRPKMTHEQCFIDIWRQPLAIGQPLPTMPLRLTGDTFVPVEFEETYVETCRRRKLI
jgi:hypothetical protein